MQKVNETIDIARKDEYLAQVEDYKKKYKDKKSELEWPGSV